MKIISVIGTRPNFIKCAPVSREIRKEHKEILVHTGQHYDYEMNKVFFDELGIPEPDFHLEVGSGDQGYQTGEMLIKTEEVLLKVKPDLVLVYGDCNTTIAGALAAVKLRIPVGHIEAGLRSFDRSMPEEINRVVADHCSDLLFCPTDTAVNNLKDEGISKGVHLTGDVMVDALFYNREIAEKTDILERFDLESKEFLIATIHRASNTDDERNLRNIVDALCEIDGTIVFPVHPRTEKFLREYGLYDQLARHIKLIKPIGYLDFLKLMNNAEKILTDSGGVQKEAYILSVPCVTLRENTEWIETVEDGWNVLVGADKEKIKRMINEFKPIKKQRNVFGDGKASEKISGLLSMVSEI